MAVPADRFTPRISEVTEETGRIPTAGVDAPRDLSFLQSISDEGISTLNAVADQLQSGFSPDDVMELISDRPSAVELISRAFESGYFDDKIPQTPTLDAPPQTETESTFSQLMGQEALPVTDTLPVRDQEGDIVGDEFPVPDETGTLMGALQNRETTPETFADFAGGFAEHGLNVGRAGKRGAVQAGMFPATIGTLTAAAANDAFLPAAADLISEGTEDDLLGGKTFGRSSVGMGLLLAAPRMLEDFLGGEDDDTPGMLEALGDLNPAATVIDMFSGPEVPEIWRVDPHHAERNPDGSFKSAQGFIQELGLNLSENFGAGAMMFPLASLSVPARVLAKPVPGTGTFMSVPFLSNAKTRATERVMSSGAMAGFELFSATGGAIGRTTAQEMGFGPLGQFAAELLGSVGGTNGPALTRKAAHLFGGSLKKAFGKLGSLKQRASARPEVVKFMRDLFEEVGEDPQAIALKLQDIMANVDDPRHVTLINAMNTPGQLAQSYALLALEEQLIRQNPAFRAALLRRDADLPTAINSVLNEAMGGGNPQAAIRIIRMSTDYNRQLLHTAMRHAREGVEEAVDSIARVGADGVPDAQTLLTRISNMFENTMAAIRANERQLWTALPPDTYTKTHAVNKGYQDLLSRRGIAFDATVKAQMKEILEDLPAEVPAPRMLEIRTSLLEQARSLRLADKPSQASLIDELAEATRTALTRNTGMRTAKGGWAPGAFRNAYDTAVDFTNRKHDIADNSIVGIVLGHGNKKNAIARAITAKGVDGAEAIQTVKALSSIPAKGGVHIPRITLDEMSYLVQDQIHKLAGDPDKLNVNALRRALRNNVDGYGMSLDELGLRPQVQNLLDRAIHQSKSRRIFNAQDRVIKQTLAGRLASKDPTDVVLKRNLGKLFDSDTGGTELAGLKRTIERAEGRGIATADEVRAGVDGLRASVVDAISDRFFTFGPEGMTINARATDDLNNIRSVLERSKLFDKEQMDLVEVLVSRMAQKQGLSFGGTIESAKSLGTNTLAGHLASFGGAQLGGKIGATSTGGSLKGAAGGSRFAKFLGDISGKDQFLEIVKNAFEPTDEGRALLVALLKDAADPDAQRQLFGALEQLGYTGPFFTGTTATTFGNFGLEGREFFDEQERREAEE